MSLFGYPTFLIVIPGDPQPLECFKSPQFPTKVSHKHASLQKLRNKTMLISEKELVGSASHCSRALKGPDHALMYCLCTSGSSMTASVRNQKQVLFTLPQQ